MTFVQPEIFFKSWDETALALPAQRGSSAAAARAQRMARWVILSRPTQVRGMHGRREGAENGKRETGRKLEKKKQERARQMAGAGVR